MSLFFPLLAFVFASLLVAAGAMALSYRAGHVIERRLDDLAGATAKGSAKRAAVRPLVGQRSNGSARRRRTRRRDGEAADQAGACRLPRSRGAAVFFGIRLGVRACCSSPSSPLARSSAAEPARSRSPGAGSAICLPSMVLARMAKRRAASHPPGARRRARPAGRQRRSRTRPRPGDSARGDESRLRIRTCPTNCG